MFIFVYSKQEYKFYINGCGGSQEHYGDKCRRRKDGDSKVWGLANNEKSEDEEEMVRGSQSGYGGELVEMVQNDVDLVG